MPRPLRLAPLAALAAALLTLPVVLAAEPTFQTRGGYKAGTPLTRQVDSCGVGGHYTQGVDSSCAILPHGLAGLEFFLDARDDLGGVAEVEVCFYQDRAFLGCGVDFVPDRANAFSVASVAGLNVEWVFTVP